MNDKSKIKRKQFSPNAPIKPPKMASDSVQPNKETVEDFDFQSTESTESSFLDNITSLNKPKK